MTLRAALYARFSDDMQNPRSAVDQLRELDEAAARHGWTVVARYADEAESGFALANRPEVRRMMADAAAGAFDLVFVESQNRLSRGRADPLAMFDLLAFHGVQLWELGGGQVSSITNAVKGIVNSEFLVNLQDSTRRGVIAAVRAGRSGGGRCYGYDLTGVTGELVPNPAQAEVVVEIYRRYAAGESPRAIAHALNARGEPGPRAGTWTASAINGSRKAGDGLLHNELYVGVRVFNRRKFRKHPVTGRRSGVLNPVQAWVREPAPALRIVDDALWGQVQALKAGKWGHAGGRAHRPKRLLSGLVRCAWCEGSMTLKGAKFVCSTRAERGPSVCTNGKVVAAAALEARVIAGVRDKLLAPEAVQASVTAFHAELNARKAEARQAAEIERDLAEITRRIDRAADSYERGVFDVEELATRVAPLKARRGMLQAELASLDAPTPVLTIHPAAAALYRANVEDLAAALQGEDAAEAREAFRALIDRIVFTPEAALGAYALTVHSKMAALLSQSGHRAGGNVGCGDAILSLPPITRSFAA